MRFVIESAELNLSSFAVGTLSEELRNNICHSCKKKLASDNASVPDITISGQGSTGTATPVSPPFWRRVFQGRQRSRPTINVAPPIGPSHSSAAPKNTNTTLLHAPATPEDAHSLRSSQTTHPTGTLAHPGPNIVSSAKEPEQPKWSVIYDPEVKQALDLHLAHTFKYDSPVRSVKMSPNGQTIAIGLENEGKTFINELRTGSSIWLVSTPLV